ncbi:MAG: SUF system Fe-S cluster assembly protein [Cytophagaceae bacterium]|jgi:FeS assembly SUF system protein|nr:SUF system Fe-S cluster assembly protein [Cytophagaceae bacterium]
MSDGTLNEMEELKKKIVDQIQTVFDPEIPVNIYELGLIYEVSIFPVNNVFIQMTLTSPNCPAAQSLPAEVEQKAKSVEGVQEVTVEVTFDPPWNQEMMSDAAKLELGFM